MEIKIGYALAKPVETQTQCDAYTAMVEAVNAHNAACAVGDTLWVIEDGTDSYTVAADVVVREPTAEELAVREEARKKAEAREKLPDTVVALQAALADADALNVDQDYRLTLLELGVTDDETTESA